MGGALVTLLVVAGIGVFLLLWLVGSYNGLVQLRNRVKEAWAQIDVQLKRRHDLVPNLVETVKGYAGHERATLEGVIQARAVAVSAGGVEHQARAEAGLGQALGRLMLLAEAYPELKANQSFLALQEELASTENAIGFARQQYNDNVMQYNTKAQSFPDLLVAGMFHFKEAEFFEIEEMAQREAPKVKF